MENNSEENQPEKSPRQRSEETVKLMQKLFGERHKDMTEQSLGKTSLIFSGSQKPPQDDSAAATVRNLNRRKGKP